MTKSRGLLPPKVFWTDEEKAIVRRLYANTQNSEIIRILGRHTEKSVWGIAKKLGVKKSPEYLRAMGGQLDGKRGSQVRFQPGHVPWIKGLKLPGKTSSTSFVKGQRAYNWMPLGAHKLNSDGYLVRKIQEGNNGGLNWEGVHRLVWKEAHGPIPPRHMIVFKAGLKTTVLEEITPDKLECIDRAENARRNNQWAQDPEMMTLYVLKGHIKRQLNRINKEAEHA
jgi:hypothetical protein